MKLLLLTTLIVLTFGCKKSASSLSDFSGKYNGTMIQDGPPPIINYQTANLTFEVSTLSSSKIKLLFTTNNFTAEANLSGSNFTIIPNTITYGATTVIIKGNGSFGNNDMTLDWIQDTDQSGSKYTVELKGTLPKF